MHSRRQEKSTDYPAFWKLDSVELKVNFVCDFSCNCDGYIKIYANGIGRAVLDSKPYRLGEIVPIKAGSHSINVSVQNLAGLPAIYAESDVCPTNGNWYTIDEKCNKIPVGFEKNYDTTEKNPEVFAFSYERIYPACEKEINGGKLFDFGKETFGYLYLENARADKNIYVGYGESEEEALDKGHTIVFETVTGSENYKLRQRAFRYIFVAPCDGIKVSADYEYLPLEYKGSFKCDNEKVNKIWDMCAYTLHLNTREVFLDGIKRDRWCWSGDAYQCYKFNNYLFFDKEIVKRTTTALRGNNTVREHINTITDYSMYWIIGLYDYYMSFGDGDYVRLMYEKAKSLFEYIKSRENSDGFITAMYNDWIFIDWSDMDKNGAICAEQMLYIETCKAMGKIAEISGESAKYYKNTAAELTEKVNRFYWNEDKGAFIDCYESGKNNVTRHANIFAIMYDIASTTQKDKIIKSVLLNDNITKITTPYFEGYELDVMGKIGNLEYIENMLDSYWGKMLDLGATTVWEEFDPTLSGAQHYAMYGEKYGKSLCHAWGASPIYLLGKYYIGVIPTKPGYEEFEIRPDKGGFGKISGTVPINGGAVTVELDSETLSVVSTKPGGKLVWKDKTYILEPDKKIMLQT